METPGKVKRPAAGETAATSESGDLPRHPRGRPLRRTAGAAWNARLGPSAHARRLPVSASTHLPFDARHRCPERPNMIRVGLRSVSQTRRLFPILALLAHLTLPIPGAAAPAGVIVDGVVRDTSSAIVAGARVDALVADRVTASATTDADGRYRLDIQPNVPFLLRVTRTGFADEHRRAAGDDGASHAGHRVARRRHLRHARRHGVARAGEPRQRDAVGDGGDQGGHGGAGQRVARRCHALRPRRQHRGHGARRRVDLDVHARRRIGLQPGAGRWCARQHQRRPVRFQPDRHGRDRAHRSAARRAVRVVGLRCDGLGRAGVHEARGARPGAHGEHVDRRRVVRHVARRRARHRRCRPAARLSGRHDAAPHQWRVRGHPAGGRPLYAARRRRRSRVEPRPSRQSARRVAQE